MISAGPSVFHLAKFVNGNPFKPGDFGDSGVPVIRIRQLLDESVTPDLAPIPPRPVWLRDGDLVFSWSATLAVRFWHRGPAILNQHLFRVDPYPGVNARWLAYVLDEATRRLEPLMHGSAMTHITLDMLRSVTVAVPAPSKQSQIADLLDRETSRIDALNAAKKRMLTLLSERIDALAKHMLDRRGLSDGNAILPIRRLLRKEDRPATGTGVVTAFRDGHVMLRSRRREEGFTESERRADYQGVRKGDVVFHGLDGFAGAIGVAEDDGICTPVYHVCSARLGFDPNYVGLVLRALALSGFLSLQSGNVRERAVDFRNWDTLARIPLPIRSLEQQRKLASDYREETKQTEYISERIRDQLRLLNERRSSVVADGVSGYQALVTAA